MYYPDSIIYALPPQLSFIKTPPINKTTGIPPSMQKQQKLCQQQHAKISMQQQQIHWQHSYIYY